jgi:hypothetical protein
MGAGAEHQRFPKLDAIDPLRPHVDEEHAVEPEDVGVLEELPTGLTGRRRAGGAALDLRHQAQAVLLHQRVGADLEAVRFPVDEELAAGALLLGDQPVPVPLEEQAGAPLGARAAPPPLAQPKGVEGAPQAPA